MTYRVIFARHAKADLNRLHDYLIERAEYIEDLEIAEQAVDAITSAISALAATPFLFRKTSRSSFRRELVVPFGSSGYVVAYEIAGPELVVVLAIRHQREEDYH
jgi:plasmid stabilization system protein ParE